MSRNVRRFTVLLLSLLTITAFAATPIFAQTDVITLDFWVYGFGENEAFIEMIERWNANNPHIQVNRIPQSFTAREDRVLIALATNTAPDILMATSQEIVSFADQGYILPFDDLIAESGLDLDVFFPSEIDTFRWDGHIWALPWPTTGGQESLMFYNRDLFAEAGLDPDTPPKTWSDLEQVSMAINRMEGDQLVRLGFNPAYVDHWNRLLYANNGDFLDPTGREVRFHRPEALEALEWIIDFTTVRNRGYETIRQFINVSGGETTRFSQGQVGIVFNNVSFFPRWKNDGLNFGAGLIPYNDKNPDATHRSTAGRLYGWGHVIPRNTPPEKVEAAFTFIKWLTTDLEGGCAVLQSLGRPSPLRECTNDPIYLDINPYWSVVGEAFMREVPFPMTPVHRDVQAQFNSAFSLAINGTMAPSAAVAEAARVAQSVLDMYWEEKDARMNSQ